MATLELLEQDYSFLCQLIWFALLITFSEAFRNDIPEKRKIDIWNTTLVILDLQKNVHSVNKEGILLDIESHTVVYNFDFNFEVRKSNWDGVLFEII